MSEANTSYTDVNFVTPQEERWNGFGGTDWGTKPRVLLRFAHGPFELLWIPGSSSVINTSAGRAQRYSGTQLLIADTRIDGRYWGELRAGGRLSASLLGDARIAEYFGSGAGALLASGYRKRTVVLPGSGDYTKNMRANPLSGAASAAVPTESGERTSDAPVQAHRAPPPLTEPGVCDVHVRLESETTLYRDRRTGAGIRVCAPEQQRFAAILAAMPLWRENDLPVIAGMYARERRRELSGEPARLEPTSTSANVAAAAEHCVFVFTGTARDGTPWTAACGAVRDRHPHHGLDGTSHDFVSQGVTTDVR